MKILYLSSHSILEYDEIKLFTEMGHEAFSMGAYQVNALGDGMRGEIPNLYHNQHLQAVSIQCSKEHLHEELIKWCDIVLMMHNARVDVEDHPQPWINGNWELIKKHKKPCIWRGIGQSNGQVEKSLQSFRAEGLKVVRHSPLDDTIPNYVGSDALIRFYKDPEEYKDYNGQVERIVNVSQALYGNDQVPSRGDHMNIDFFKRCVEGLEWKVFGPYNDYAGPNNGGSLSFTDLKQMLRFNRVFFYVGTRPANYTLGFIEAWMSGIPVISIGPDQGNLVYTDQKTFEVPSLIGKSGEAGYWSDNIQEVRTDFQSLLLSKDKALEVGAKGRAKAIELFGKNKIMKDWENFFNTL